MVEGEYGVLQTTRALELASHALQSVPIPGIKTALDGLVKLIANVQSTSDNEEQLDALCQRISRLLTLLDPLLVSAGFVDKDVLSPALLTRLEDLFGQLIEIASARGILKSQKLLLRMLRPEDKVRALTVLNAKLDAALSEFLLKGSISTEDVLYRVDRNVSQAFERARQEAKYQRLEMSTADSLLFLPRADAHFSSSQNTATRCLEGTRTNVLREISEWINNSEPSCPRLFWLNGAAGMGKSTIAQTVAELADEDGDLGASFFFSRNEADRSDSGILFTTIAYQLAHFKPLNPEYKSSIQELLSSRPTIGRDALRFQFSNLLIKPLAALTTDRRVLIVIDALDECSSDVSAAEILLLLSQGIPSLKINIKVLITSRPAHHISSRFETMVNQSLSDQLVLHDIEQSIVQDDITRYLHFHLADLSGDTLRGEGWPREGDIRALADKASGLFIFASTAVRFIQEARDPKQQLRGLLAAGPVLSGARQANLDGLYLQVLHDSYAKHQDHDALENFKTIVGTIALLRDAMSPISLSRFLRISISSVNAAILFLQSVIIVPKSSASELRLLHPSFPEFLIRADRCLDYRFTIDPSEHHHRMASLCLDHMLSSLRRDMCEIRDPTKLNSEVDDLDSRLQQHVTPELRYSCLHWAHHVSHSRSLKTNVDVLLKSLQTFCRSALLFWVEILSLFGALDSAISSLSMMEEWFQKESLPDHVTIELLRDCSRLILAFHEPISRSAAHVYHSALPFTPRCLMSERYASELSSSMKVILGREKGWGGRIRALEGHTSAVTAVCFSTDGTRIVSSSRDHTVCLWSYSSGALLETFIGHVGAVGSVVFAPDGARIASSGIEDGVIRLWNAVTGSSLGLLQSTVPAQAIAFSWDSTLIAAAHDCSVCLWDVATKEKLLEFHPSRRPLTALEFSPDVSTPGYRLAGGNDALWICDTNDFSNCDLQVIFRGVWDSTLACIRYTLDGSRIIATTLDESVRIWDAVSRQCIHVIEKAHRANFNLNDHLGQLHILPDNERFVTDLGIWTIQTGVKLAPLWFATDSILAFSRDGTIGLTSPTSRDVHIEMWRSTTSPEGAGTPLFPIRTSSLRTRLSKLAPFIRASGDQNDNTLAHLSIGNGFVVCTSISKRTQQLARGMTDGTLDVWDFTRSRRLFKTHGPRSTDPNMPMWLKEQVNAVMFSPEDDALVGAWSNLVRIWNTQTFQCLSELSLHDMHVKCIAFPYDWRVGMNVALGGWCFADGNKFSLWNPSTGKYNAVVKMKRKHLHLAFTRSGRHIFSQDDDESCMDFWAVNDDDPLMAKGDCLETLKQEADLFLDDGWLFLRRNNVPERLCWIPAEKRPVYWCSDWKSGGFVQWNKGVKSTGILLDIHERLKG